MREYLRPTSLTQGLDMLAQRPLRIVAGATDVFPAATTRNAWQGKGGESWLDVSGLQELSHIEEGPAGWRIGAMVRWSDIAKADLPLPFRCLQRAALEVGGLQIQNRATLVGNLCNASPAADSVPPLLCLNAAVEISSKQTIRMLPLQEFLQGNRQTACDDNEMVTAVLIPRAGLEHFLPTLSADGLVHSSSEFYKLGSRRYLVISIVMTAALIATDENDAIVDCRLAVGACSPVAQRLQAMESELTGCYLSEAISSCKFDEWLSDANVFSPIDDIRASANYRSKMIGSSIRELLQRHLEISRNDDGRVAL